MLRQLVFGGAICLVNIAIHAALMAVVVVAAQHTSRAAEEWHERRRMMAIMVATVSVLLAAHTIEVAVWSAAYRLIEMAPGNEFYFAFVNYTTLGYGEILPPADWRLIGPITAMSGVLLFGWSTAVIFEVLRTSAGALRNLPTHSES